MVNKPCNNILPWLPLPKGLPVLAACTQYGQTDTTSVIVLYAFVNKLHVRTIIDAQHTKLTEAPIEVTIGDHSLTFDHLLSLAYLPIHRLSH